MVATTHSSVVRAPEFPPGLDWFNTDQPLTVAGLRGKIVLLDFWTYGCINCLHVLPDLQRLEEKYGGALVVIGVHSGKFSNESHSDNIQQSLARYGVTHPVVNDAEFQVWQHYTIRAWPSCVLIDPTGRIAATHSGEGVFAYFDPLIADLAADCEARGLLDRRTWPLHSSAARPADSPLLFPGKVLADASRDRLFIADTGHNRIVVIDLNGQVQAVIGDGQARLADGDWQQASFRRPQGMTLANPFTLYVADTDNHALRRVDLAQGFVETVAGVGEQGYMRDADGLARGAALNSPWDVLQIDGEIFIAMAGQHQIWVYEPERRRLRLWAGQGYEALEDGWRRLANLNQPSGLATDGESLFVADSEASAIRQVDLDEVGMLRTLVGTGLFDFGDVDGREEEVRLQHPLGVAYDDGWVYIADTYNHKIKVLNPITRAVETLLGNGTAGWRDGDVPLLAEPGGLSVAEGYLYIADTNNHVIRVADLERRAASTLLLRDPDGRLATNRAASRRQVRLAAQTVGAGVGTIRLAVQLPEGYKVNGLAASQVSWQVKGGAVTLPPASQRQVMMGPKFPLRLEAHFEPGSADIFADLSLYYCAADRESLCLIEHVRLEAPVTVSAENALTEINLSYLVPPPV